MVWAVFPKEDLPFLVLPGVDLLVVVVVEGALLV